MARKREDEEDVPVCTPISLPPEQALEAAAQAITENPANAPPAAMALVALAAFGFPGGEESEDRDEELPGPTKDQLAFLTSKWWKSGGVDLTVGFIDNQSAAFRNLWLAHANDWAQTANVRFRWTQNSPQVRVATARGGYWSYLGTDILSIPQNQATMNLEGFSERTSEAQWRSIARHEVGHTLGCPHEQLRAAIVGRIDPQKAIAYFRQVAGWDERTTRHNVLTPLEERSLMASDTTDEISIMTYSLPASIMRDGRAVAGGKDLSVTDRAFVAKVYPRSVEPPPPPPPTGGLPATLEARDAEGKVLGRYKLDR